MTQFIKGGIENFVHKSNDKHIVGKQITLTELKAIPAGYGARIGIIPWCEVDDKIYHILCDIFWQNGKCNGNVIGDLGGGVKKNERPYDKMYNELKEEVPGWVDILKSQIEYGPIAICTIEYLHVPYNALRYAITVFVNITPYIKVLNDLFRPTREIKQLNAHENIVHTLLYTKDINYGLIYYRDYLTYSVK
jgi:hypothetical protein